MTISILERLDKLEQRLARVEQICEVIGHESKIGEPIIDDDTGTDVNTVRKHMVKAMIRFGGKMSLKQIYALPEMAGVKQSQVFAALEGRSRETKDTFEKIERGWYRLTKNGKRG